MDYRQSQNWVHSMETRTYAGARREAVSEKGKMLNRDSSDFVRHDVVWLLTVFLLVLLVSFLCKDMIDLYGKNRDIGKLSASIERMENDNSFLRSEIDDAQNSTFMRYLRTMNADKEDPETTEIIQIHYSGR